MYCSRPVERSPSAIRIISRAPRQARQASYFPNSSFSISPFYARPSAPLDPFRGFERLLEDISSPAFPFGLVSPQQLHQHVQQQQHQHQHQQHVQQQQHPFFRLQPPTFAPRFDVSEQDGVYELRGEVPGVEAKDLEVEFSDAQTLVIKGRVESESSRSLPSANAPAQEAAQSEGANDAVKTVEETTASAEVAEGDKSDAASVHSTGSYQKPSVEDATEPAAEETTTAAPSAPASEAQDTPATTPGVEQQQSPQAQQPQQAQAQSDVQAQAPQQQQQQNHFWISERSTGSFQRVFKFQHRVDQEGVTASLKNGILKVVVPKAKAPEARRIVVA